MTGTNGFRRAGVVVALVLALGTWVPTATAPAAAEVTAPRTPTCAAPPGGGPMRVTADCVDPRFDEPYIDVREWRDTPVRHLYVHGGFAGTDARFSFYFPPAEQFRGRFYQSTHQLVFSENTNPYNIGMAAAAGAYVVQTNMGGSEYPRTAADALSGRFDPTIGGYRVNAAAAKLSRTVAAEVYGDQQRGRHGRVYGYLYGGSGGAYQTITSAEVTQGVWDGFLPFVMGTPNAIPNVFTARVNALRVLRDDWPAILDALEPGGSGDPYAGLDAEERRALREATRYGFPPGAWFNYVPMGGGPLSLVASYVPLLDPTYVDDFWTQPGYLGTDPRSSIRAERVQHDATVLQVVAGPPRRLVLSSVPAGDLTGADLVVTTGAAAGSTVPLGAVSGDTVGFGPAADPAVVGRIQAGDEVRIDNSLVLAEQTYHRHQIPEPGSPYDHPVYDQFRDRDGRVLYPQRDVLVGPVAATNATGQINTGRFHGKMIVMQSLLDGDAVPWQADWYRSRARAALGRRLDDSYRLWFTDNAQHSEPTTDRQRTHVVSYQGVLEQGLRDLGAWVERGVRPPESTSYAVRRGQVEVPATARDRRGIQPVVHLTANGRERAEVAAGQPVRLTARIEVPPGTGEVVAADWDFLGEGTYPVAASLGRTRPGAHTVTVTATHTFPEPGTYFPALRVASQRDGDRATPYARVQNLGRVRVVVR